MRNDIMLVMCKIEERKREDSKEKGSSLQSKYRKLKNQFVSRIIHSFAEYLSSLSLSIWMNESAAN